jgi:DNA-binding MarR family transcriptional regulator
MPSLSILPSPYRAGHLSAAPVRALFEELAPAGDGLLLLELGRKDRQTPGALAKALGVQRSSATAMIQRVREYGLVRQVGKLNDRRSRVLELTSMGAVVARVGRARVNGVEQRILGSLHPDDLATLEQIVTAVAEARISPGDVD